MESSSDEKDLIGEGTVVRDRKWGGQFTGTVVRREGDHVFVAWHNSFVEDELTVNEVEVWPDAPQAKYKHWKREVKNEPKDGHDETWRANE